MDSQDDRPKEDSLSRVDDFVVRAAGTDANHVLLEATRALARSFGGRGACLWVEGNPRLLNSTEADGADWAMDAFRDERLSGGVADGRIVAVAGHEGGGAAAASGSHPGSIVAIPLATRERRWGAVLISTPSPLATSGLGRRKQQEARLIADVASALIEAQHSLTIEQTITPFSAESGQAARPAAAVPATGSSASESAPAESSAARPTRTVLIVDDDPDQSEILKIALSDEGYSVRTAGDGVQCLAAVKDSPPDLVLMDVNMPGLDGTDVATRLRALPLACPASIIFVSGCPDLALRMRSLGMPDTDFLPKPYSLEQLLVRMEKSFERVREQTRLREQAHVDDLTGLGNLRLLRERLATEASRLERYGTPASVVLVDVDKLKAINDEFGHVIGSEALQAIGRVLRAEIRETDLAVRYGGDEFVVLLPHTTLVEGLAFADRVLRQIRLALPHGITLTASIGVAARERKANRSFESLLAHADVAVYRAKHAGGNRVCAYGDTRAGDGQPVRTASSRTGRNAS